MLSRISLKDWGLCSINMYLSMPCWNTQKFINIVAVGLDIIFAIWMACQNFEGRSIMVKSCFVHDWEAFSTIPRCLKPQLWVLQRPLRVVLFCFISFKAVPEQMSSIYSHFIGHWLPCVAWNYGSHNVLGTSFSFIPGNCWIVWKIHHTDPMLYRNRLLPSTILLCFS